MSLPPTTMANEQRRYELYLAARETFGPEPAQTLMYLLPRAGYPELQAELVAVQRLVTDLQAEVRYLRSLLGLPAPVPR